MSRVVTCAVVACSMLSWWAQSAAACPPPPSGEATLRMASVAGSGSLADLTGGDPFFYTSQRDPRPSTTHSKVPHLPFYTGFMQTNDTYRFVNVAEQVLTMIGEGKHGLWRIQENGTIREYLRRGATGLPADADVADPRHLAVLESDYSHFLAGEGFDGYKSSFEPVNDSGMRNFVDLPITHPKYRGKYRNHPPIDLPHWYCTMSSDGFPNAATAMRFAFAQRGANRIGPLGRRAGLDVEELYTNVVRLRPFPDARAWVNVGTSRRVHWQAIDARRTKAEYYLYERPFFNVPYLFVSAVFDTKRHRDFRYVRPHGAFYEHLRRAGRSMKTRVTWAPRFHLENGRTRRVVGTRLYGVHHPNRPAEYGASGGGACPMKGGDWADYPATRGGAGWPTQYQEVTPLCDGVLVDIKFFANLDGATWASESKYLANAGTGRRTVRYTVKPGVYGRFTDRYLTRHGIRNPHATGIGPEEVLRYGRARDPVRSAAP